MSAPLEHCERKMGKLSLAALMLMATAAQAQQPPQCAPRAAVVAQLAQKYLETRRSIGITGNGMVMEVYASAESGTWTITMTTPQGLTCLVASGQGFESVVETLPPPGVPG